jgi:hypothetical protein
VRFAFIGVVAIAVVGCSGNDRSAYPTALTPSVTTGPTPTPLPGLAWLGVVVIEDGGGGGCVRGATVEVVAGQGVGKSIRQADNCSVWDPDFTAQFNSLTPGVAMTLRASAEGYAPREVIVVPTLGPQMAFEIELSRIR